MFYWISPLVTILVFTESFLDAPFNTIFAVSSSNPLTSSIILPFLIAAL
jgi:hypothetical protein